MSKIETYLAKFKTATSSIPSSRSAFSGLSGSKGSIERMKSYLEIYSKNIKLINDDLIKHANNVLKSATDLTDLERKALADKIKSTGLELAKEWMRKNKNT